MPDAYHIFATSGYEPVELWITGNPLTLAWSSIWVSLEDVERFEHWANRILSEHRLGLKCGDTVTERKLRVRRHSNRRNFREVIAGREGKVFVTEFNGDPARHEQPAGTTKNTS